MVRFAVHNAAVMTDEVRSKIFVQGYTTKSTGYGLGTFSMKIIGENYLGGKVSFVSEPGSGTEFSFELPVLPKVLGLSAAFRVPASKSRAGSPHSSA